MCVYRVDRMAKFTTLCCSKFTWECVSLKKYSIRRWSAPKKVHIRVYK